jgi:hypothetical protein
MGATLFALHLGKYHQKLAQSREGRVLRLEHLSAEGRNRDRHHDGLAHAHRLAELVQTRLRVLAQ